MSYTGVALRNTVNTRESEITPKRCELVTGLDALPDKAKQLTVAGAAQDFHLFPQLKT